MLVREGVPAEGDEVEHETLGCDPRLLRRGRERVDRLLDEASRRVERYLPRRLEWLPELSFEGRKELIEAKAALRPAGR